VRVLPTQEQATALRATLGTCNEAASWLSARMHADRVYRKHDAQKRFYTELKRRFGLSAQPAIRVIAKAADAYATLRANIDAGSRLRRRLSKIFHQERAEIGFPTLRAARPRTLGSNQAAICQSPRIQRCRRPTSAA